MDIKQATPTAKRLRSDGLEFLRKSSRYFQDKITTKSFKDATHDTHCSKIFIGVAAEYLLKSCYLSSGFHIHEFKMLPKILPLDYDIKKASNFIGLNSSKTLNFTTLIDNMNNLNISKKINLNDMKTGLQIIQSWRNDSAHLGANPATTPEDTGKAFYSIHKLKDISENPCFVEQGSVNIKLDYKATNGMLRIFEIIIEDYETNEEIYVPNDFDGETYWGYFEEPVDTQPIVDCVKKYLLHAGYEHADDFGYNVDTEEFIRV